MFRLVLSTTVTVHTYEPPLYARPFTYVVQVIFRTVQ